MVAPSIFELSSMSQNAAETTTTSFASSTALSSSYTTSNTSNNEEGSQLTTKTAPRKPRRLKSGSLEVFATTNSLASPPDSHSPSEKRRTNDSSTKSSSSGRGDASSSQKKNVVMVLPSGEDKNNADNDSVNDKWVALNDSIPTTAKRRVRRVIRSYSSDSDMSEASSIDSSSGMSANKGGGEGKLRKKIQARNHERQTRQDQRKLAKENGGQQRPQGEANGGQQRPQGEDKGGQDNHGYLDEDDELNDTDKEMPISEELEIKLRKNKRREQRRGKSPQLGCRRQANNNGEYPRRGGRKEENVLVSSTLNSDNGDDEQEMVTGTIIPFRRSNSLDGRRRRKKRCGNTMDGTLSVDSQKSSGRIIRSASADRLPLRNRKSSSPGAAATSGFSMLLNDSQNDVSLRNIPPLRASKGARPSLLKGDMMWQNEVDDDFMATMNTPRQESSARGLVSEIDSDLFAFSPTGPESSLKNDMRSRRSAQRSENRLEASRQIIVTPDRFLCMATTTDFAPRMSSSSRDLNISDYDEEDDPVRNPKAALDKVTREESGEGLAKPKKGSSSSLDAPRRRKSNEDPRLTGFKPIESHQQDSNVAN